MINDTRLEKNTRGTYFRHYLLFFTGFFFGFFFFWSEKNLHFHTLTRENLNSQLTLIWRLNLKLSFMQNSSVWSVLWVKRQFKVKLKEKCAIFRDNFPLTISLFKEVISSLCIFCQRKHKFHQ